MKKNMQHRDKKHPALISCIVPVYNGGKYLAEALESVFAQTYSPLEIIVVDDGSIDNTGEIIAAFAGWIKYFRQQNAGPAAARNRGIQMANGSFFAFLDADDRWHPEKLSRQMAMFRENANLEICLTHIQNFPSPELKQSVEMMKNDRQWQPFPGNMCQTLLVKKEVFETVGLFDPALITGEDIDWFRRAREKNISREMLTEVLVDRRIHLENLTRQKARETRDNLMKQVKKMVDRQKRKKASEQSEI